MLQSTPTPPLRGGPFHVQHSPGSPGNARGLGLHAAHSMPVLLVPSPSEAASHPEQVDTVCGADSVEHACVIQVYKTAGASRTLCRLLGSASHRQCSRIGGPKQESRRRRWDSCISGRRRCRCHTAALSSPTCLYARRCQWTASQSTRWRRARPACARSELAAACHGRGAQAQH